MSSEVLDSFSIDNDFEEYRKVSLETPILLQSKYLSAELVCAQIITGNIFERKANDCKTAWTQQSPCKSFIDVDTQQKCHGGRLVRFPGTGS